MHDHRMSLLKRNVIEQHKNSNRLFIWLILTLKVLITIDAWDTFKQDEYSTMGGEGGCRVGEV